MHTKEPETLLINPCSSEAIDDLNVACYHIEEGEEEVVEVNPVQDSQVYSVHGAVLHPECQVECQKLQIHIEQLEGLDSDGDLSNKGVECEDKAKKKADVTDKQKILK